MTIKVGDVLDASVTLTSKDGEMLTVEGAMTVMEAPPAPVPPDPTPEPPDPNPEPPNPVPGDLVEKNYMPEGFNGDFAAMQTQILADQKAAGDNKMRAVVQLARGKKYEYAKNDWLTGVQNYRCEAVGTGANPQLRCSSTNAGMWVDRGPLKLGKGANCFVEPNAPMSKTKQMSLIASAKKGDMTVKLLNAADTSKLKPGRWHAVFSYCQQIGGYPPNVRWIDYIKVSEISGTTVTLDRPLAHAHFADYWEDPKDEMSVGKARIGCWDGWDSSDTRCTLSGHWKDIDFIGEGQAGTDVTYVESHINCLFEGCKISNLWVSMNKRVEVRGCSFTGAGEQAAEPDKLSETLILDKCTTPAGKYLQGATGFMEVIIKGGCNLNCIAISPRKLTVNDSTIDAHGDTKMNVPYGVAYNGPNLDVSFTNVEFVASSPHQATWAYPSAPVSPLPLSPASWAGKKLVIPRSFGGFENWLVWLSEGAMVFTGSKVSDPRNYGRVDKIYAPADGSALWADVTWLNGSMPTSGNLNLPQKGLRKLTWGTNTRITTGNWLDPDFVCMTGTPADRDFPEGIS
jgi:hypothetical protein